MTFFNELKRRNVFRVGIAYVIAAWLIVQVVSAVLDMLVLPAWVGKLVLLLLVTGLPIALIFAWAFELTPDGVKRESEVDRAASIRPKTGKRLDRVIIGVLVVALGYFAFDKFVLDPSRDADLVEATRQTVVEETVEQPVEPTATEDIAPSIAVLPFVNMSSDPEQEYFSDGISEELLNLLAKIPQLRVIARTSSFSFKGRDIPVAQIAQTLNVAHVLEGSVRKSGSQVRITAQLIRASDSSHLWSVSYDRELEDIFAVQDEIAATVVARLRVTLLGPAPKIVETDPAAYDLFLRARLLLNQFTEESLEQALQLYQQALAIDPNYAEAWIDMADLYFVGALTGVLVLDNSFTLAREAAERALAIDPDYAYAYAILSNIELIHNRDLDAAVTHFTRAIELEPENWGIFNVAHELLSALGRPHDVYAVSKHSVSIDPVNEWNHFTLGRAYAGMGRFDEALISLRAAQSLSPQMPFASSMIGRVLLREGKPGEALLEFNHESIDYHRLTGQAMAHFALGQLAQSDAALAELKAKHEKIAAIEIALVLAYRREVDRAFMWLDKAVQYNDTGLTGINNFLEYFSFENLYSDSRWLQIQQRIGVAPEQIDAIEFNVTLPE